MSKKFPSAPPPMSERDIRQDMIGLLTQSCQMKTSRALAFAGELAKWIFETEEPKERSLRWWACKCSIIAANSTGMLAHHIIENAGAILAFMNEETDLEDDDDRWYGGNH